MVLGAGSLAFAADPYTPLQLYNGTWQVTSKGDPKAYTVANQCQRAGRFFVCDQSVNGGPSALLVFIPLANQPGHYWTQNIRPEGRATSRGDLVITGDTWVLTNTWDAGGHTVYYRTTNQFAGHSHIHFEQAESDNNKDWKITASGDEVRQNGK